MIRFAKFLAPVVAIVAVGAAHATAYTLNSTGTLPAQGTAVSNLNVTTQSGTIANLVAGDTITGTFSFANGQAFTIQDAGSFEYFYLALTGTTNSISSTYSISLNGVGGSVNSTTYNSQGNGGFIAVGDFGNLTDSSFSFTGFNYSVAITAGSGQNFTASSLSGSKGVVGSVPEPASWAMMLTGFGAVGFAMRRNRKANVHFA